MQAFQVIWPRSVYLMAPLLLKAQVLAAVFCGWNWMVLWIDEVHTEPTQVWPLGHALPQAAQLAASLERFASQPLAGLLSQLPKPMRQPVSTHWLLTHCDWP